jgi:UDP-N-acetylglucosamine--N-acetylmuramyl-(pentapeptide) pyrophosphoryl-undecaprenol N-acetylglucosamine transferase
MKTAVVVAGGTGGHLYPGIATARAIVSEGTWEAVFIVRKGDMGKALLQREGFKVFEIPGQGWPRKFSRQMLKFPWVQLTGFKEAWSVLGQLKPQVIIGMGGYLSFPVILAARLRRIPALVHEQNVHPGLSNRFLAPWVQSIAVSFDESRRAFPAQKVWLSGLPVRPEIGKVSSGAGRQRFKLDPEKFTVLVFGGSLGARHLNESVADTWPLLSEWADRLQVLHVTGERDYSQISQRYAHPAVKSVVLPYCHDMPAALGAADFVICRAGASTVAELVVSRKPALLVPFPFASENHQFYNAEVMVQQGAADMLLDNMVSPERLAERLSLYLQNPERLSLMKQKLEALAVQSGHEQAAQRLAEKMTILP